MLYVSTAAAVVALKARMAVIENVPEVLSDKTEVVATARKVLLDCGYYVSDAVLSATDLGAAQTRKRHFLIATHRPHVDINEAQKKLGRPAMTLREVIGDLEHEQYKSFMDSVPALSAENQARIDYLFDHNLYDLPNDVRPDCHRMGIAIHRYMAAWIGTSLHKPSRLDSIHRGVGAIFTHLNVV